MYDFDMMESFYDDFDDDEFTEACRECNFDDLFVENEFGECEYVGDVYTEAFGKKKKSGFGMPFGSSKKKSGFSLGNNKKKKKKNGGKSFSNLPTPAKITATVAAALAVAAGIIVSIKAIAKHIRKKYTEELGFDASKENYNEMIADIKERMKKLKSTHKDYCKAHKEMTKEEKKERKQDYKYNKKLLNEQMRYAKLGKFCTEKFSIIKALCNGIKGIGSKIARKCESLNIPCPWKKKNEEIKTVDLIVPKGQAAAARASLKKESAFIESVVNSFIQESAEYITESDDMDDLYDDVYESVLSDLYDNSDDYDDYEESYEDDFDDLF